MQPHVRPAAPERPFRLHTAPSDAFAHPGWRQARTAVLAALGRGAAVALLGLPGTGKTLLLEDVAQTLRDEGRTARLVERGDALQAGPGDAILGVGPGAAVLRVGAGDAVLLVDEAGRMDADALARLCGTEVPIVLAALPGFAERLTGLFRPIERVTLEPLAPEEVARFVAARLAAAGRPRDMLEPDAVLALARQSGGSLRLVNLLAGTALFLADQERAAHVGRRHVDEAASMRDGVEREAASPAAPARAATPPDAAPPALPVTPPVRRAAPSLRRRRAAAGMAAASLALALAGGWLVAGRTDAPNAGPPSAAGGLPAEAAVRSPAPTVPDQGAGPEAAPEPAAPASAAPRPVAPAAPVSFRGRVYNETIQQAGQMSLVIRQAGPAGAITARFRAWGGLLGAGELAGTLSEDGRVVASGQLMVGRNPFYCDLNGRIVDGTLTGSATFVRPGGGRRARSTFSLTQI